MTFTFAEALCVGSVTDVAVTVTISTPAGAVKVVGMPLSVIVRLKFAAPQGVAPVVLQVQVTPAFALSPVTVAITGAIVPSTIFAGGGVDNVTTIPETTLTFAEALFVLSVTDVAVIVTTSTPAGAGKVVATPLSV